ncbi:hypothetical protein [Ferruginibacter albus]|uniref:hypothetical protein n=1 Tax=Ferruginibacter albus TaxID=2875540 RepID=UPI001CC7B2C2|nr:hypothetical protein [Ferruginibacter albus]UAY53569.1 hypothetical protein K9M53_07855 [Ferruginibacter albus]
MIWQYKHIYRLLFCTLIVITSATKLNAQNVTSPYSILGIGDIDTKDYGRYFFDGSTANARRAVGSYNFSNPASLTALTYKLVNFDIGMRGRVSDFQMPSADTSTAASKDFAVKRISFSFKAGKKTGIAFGLKPYSSVNYKYEATQAILDGYSTYTKAVDGSGGINQVYFSAGRELFKNLSIGITASYLFGSLQNTTSYSSIALPINLSRTDIDFLYGANVLVGLQYYTAADKKWQHQFGLTGSVSTKLSGQTTSEYVDSNVSASTFINQSITKSSPFQMPSSIGFGYAGISNNKWIFSVDANYTKWPHQQVDYVNSSTTSTLRLSAGIEYSKKVKTAYYEYEKYFVAGGFSAENSYILLSGNYIKDYAVSLGGGINLSKNMVVYGGVESGVKGDLTKMQIKENYTNILFGISIKDLWYGTKKLGRFN